MALTIDDIVDKQFKVAGAGYDRNDVDDFLDAICDELANEQDRIAQLEAELSQARNEVEEAKAAAQRAEAAPAMQTSSPVSGTSQALEGILLSAQRLADEAVENAKTKANAIVKEAEDKAEQIVGDAQGEKDMLTSQLNTLKASVAECKSGFLNMINKYKSMLEKEDL